MNMKEIKQTRAILHKKKKVTAAAIKVEYANKKRRPSLISPIATKNKKRSADIDAASCIHTPSNPKKKVDMVYKKS